MQHVPVLKSEVLDLLNPQSGEVVIDVTLGLGGHAKAFLEMIGPKGKLIGIDADNENLKTVEQWNSGAMEQCEFIHSNFRDINQLDLPKCDILFADLGLSSPHLDDPSKGFSFKEDGPLDCRYDRSQGQTAAALIKSCNEEELSSIFKEYGELKKAYPLARRVLEVKPETTSALLKAIEDIYKWESKKVASQVFQALRIAVNDEIGALENLLTHGPGLLNPGGRMGVISYHSLEDRLVKQRFRALTIPVKDSITGSDIAPASYELLTKKPIRATLTEIESNPRARSAHLRAIKKVP